MEITEKELLAIKAVFYLARTNSRLNRGGLYVEDIHDLGKSKRIPFLEAVNIVGDMLIRSEEEKDLEDL